MLKFSSLLLLLIFLTACTLSGEQENRLNKQLSRYVKAYNENNTLEYAGLTHPAVVRYYTDLGDSGFVNHFSTQIGEREVSIYNPLYREMRTDGKWMERKYTITKDSYDEHNSSYELYAISSDGGDNWFFLTEDDYFLEKIPLKKRLFSR